MKRLGAWWRRMSGLLVACLVATLLAAPTLDAIVCTGEGGAMVSAGLSDGPAVAPGDHADIAADHDALASCVHGHCHHGLAFGLVLAEGLPALAPLSQSHPPALTSAPASRTPPGPERPPRA